MCVCVCYRFVGCDYVRCCHSYVVNDDYCTCTATTERLQQAIRAGGQQPVGTTVAPPRPNLVHSPQPARRLQYTPSAGESKYDDEADNDDGDSNTTNASTKKRKTNDNNVMQSRRSAKKDSKKQKKDSPSGTHTSHTHTVWGKQW